MVEVQHIAKLARLGLSQDEVKKMEKELSAVLDYFEKLKEVDVSKVEPTSHPYLLENVMREDEARKQALVKANELIGAASEREGRYVKVKSVL